MTGALAYNASTTDVQTALNALPTIAGIGASVTVTKNASGALEVEFGGTLAGKDVPDLLSVDASGLTAGGSAVTTVVSELNTAMRIEEALNSLATVKHDRGLGGGHRSRTGAPMRSTSWARWRAAT